MRVHLEVPSQLHPPRRALIRPSLQELEAAREVVRAVVDAADVAADVREARLDDIGIGLGYLVRPGRKGSAESMRRLPAEIAGAREEREERVLAQRPAPRESRKDQRVGRARGAQR